MYQHVPLEPIQDNLLQGHYLAELTKDVFTDPSASDYHHLDNIDFPHKPALPCTLPHALDIPCRTTCCTGATWQS